MSEPDAQKRWSLQAASLVNDAYSTLSNELQRATYLLKCQGIYIDEETDTQMDPMFLMEQMEYRETLESAESASDPLAAVSKIRKTIKKSIKSQVESFALSADKGDWQACRNITRQWQFLDKLLSEAKAIEERLDNP